MGMWIGAGTEMAVGVSGDGAAFQSETQHFLFNATPPHLRTPNFEYDVSADGERFLMIEPLGKPEYPPLTLVTVAKKRSARVKRRAIPV